MRWVLSILIALMPGLASATEYASPDHAFNVIVDHQGKDSCEAKIRFGSRGREILKVDYVSPNHDQGSCIAMATWTPNSQFFVFSLENSGGHQPWHAPIMFFSRKAERILPLENYLKDPITDPDFSVSEPDIIQFTTTKIPLDANAGVHRSIRLGTLDLR